LPARHLLTGDDHQDDLSLHTWLRVVKDHLKPAAVWMGCCGLGAVLKI